MANWEATTQATAIDTSAATVATTSAREATRSASSVGGGGNSFFANFFGGGGGFSIVGIDANRVPEMREQIRMVLRLKQIQVMLSEVKKLNKQ